MKRALFIRSLKLGDSILFSPIIESFHRIFPEYKIDLITHFIQSRDYWRHFPYIDNIFIEGNKRIDKIKLIMKLRSMKYEYIFVSSQECGSALKYYFIGGTNYVGFKDVFFYGISKDKFYFLFDKYVSGKDRIYDTFRNFELLKLIGVNEEFYIKKFVFYPDENKKEELHNLKKQYSIGDYAVISLIGHSPGRNFPIDMWKKISSNILIKHDLKFIFIGVEKDFQLNEEYIRYCKDIKGINLSGQTDFDLLYYILEEAKLLLTVDNGIMHFSSIFDINRVVLWGPGDYKIFSPEYINNKNLKVFRVSNLTCGPCQYVCDNMQCYKKLNIGSIVNYINNLLN